MSGNSTAGNDKDAAREARRQIADHKGAFRNRLLADRRVSNAAKVVGCGIAEHINRASKEAKVGVRRLAQILHMGQGPVSEAIHELVNARRIEVEWGVQGGRKVPSAFKLIVNPETPDLFSFNKYELADFIEAETEFARQNSTEFARQNSKVRRRVRQKGRASSSNKPTEFVKSAQRVRPAEQNLVLTPGNPVGTTGVTTTDADRDSAPTSATDGPVARTAHAALNDHLAAKQSSPSRDEKNIGRPAANADAAAADAWRQVQFLNVSRTWQPDCVGDEAAAYAVFCRVMDAGHSPHDVIAALQPRLFNSGGKLPPLAEALLDIERGQARSGRQ